MDTPKISIIIPCYNEEKTIIALLKQVKALSLNKEIIVVDDGSTDNTRELLKGEGRKLADYIIFHDCNQGKGAALHTGFKKATGDILIPQDADLELNPNDIIKVVTPIVNNETRASCGSRFLNKKRQGSFIYYLANRLLTFYSNFMSKQHLTDINVCYVAFKRELLEPLNLQAKRFDFNPEIIGRLSNLGVKIIEVPINYYPRTHQEGKKVKFKDGFRALRAIFKYRNKSHRPLE